MWYGPKLHLAFSKNLRRSQNRRLRLSKQRFIPSFFTRPLGWRNLCFHVPTSWECTILKACSTAPHRLVILTTPTYYFKFPLFSRMMRLRYDKGANVITGRMQTSPSLLRVFLIHLSHLFSSFLKPFLIKLKFKGKGYYVFKSTRSTVTPQFGFAHRRYFYTTSFRIRFLSKTKIVFFGFSKTDVLKVAYKFQTYKPINVFTGRGVRFAKQIIYRKTGKVSLYR